jgi:hypothetical protein
MASGCLPAPDAFSGLESFLDSDRHGKACAPAPKSAQRTSAVIGRPARQAERRSARGSRSLQGVPDGLNADQTLAKHERVDPVLDL